MATTIQPTTLTYSVTETITLNGVAYDSIQSNTIASIGNYVNNVFSVDSGAQAIITFARQSITPRNAEYSVDKARYLRLTNGDDTASIKVTLSYQTSSTQIINVAPQGTFILTDFFGSSGATDGLETVSIDSASAVDVPYVIASVV
tara:strand:- start:249 stop:686 length:438 start_codon:yes stop_codon:yes gene_type:complete